MIAIIDYGAGNLRSVVNSFAAIGAKTRVVSSPDELGKASAIVLPGVGAFGEGMVRLRQLGLVEALNEQVLTHKKPYLGICLGLQFLAQESFEHGSHQGLGWIGGTVQRIDPQDRRYRVPHIGWNTVQIERPCPLFNGLDEEPVFYFVHSYHLVVKPEALDAVTSSCCHGVTMTASVQKDHILGVQFHPEKSQRNGLKVLENFVRLL